MLILIKFDYAVSNCYVSFNSGGAMNDLWHLVGDSSTADSAQFSDCPRVFTNYILVHGALMVIGWGVFLLWGAYIARYFNSSGKTWFYLHVTLQVRCLYGTMYIDMIF